MLEAVALNGDPTRPDREADVFSAWNCALPAPGVLEAARAFLARKPAWVTFQKQIIEATSRPGDEEHVGWSYPDPERAMAERARIYKQTLLNAHAYVATQLESLPQTRILAVAEDVFVVAMPPTPPALIADRLESLASERLPGLTIKIEKGAVTQ